MMRGGVVICPIWKELDGKFQILIHYIRTTAGVELITAYTRYNGEITDISDKIRTLAIVPDWRERVASQTSPL